MKRHTLVLFSFFASLAVSAQEVVATQGDTYSNASANIDFTIGEVIIDTGTDGTNDLTQGFHQTNGNSCLGDFNLDGAIDATDLLFLLGDYGCNNACNADLNGDGFVGGADMLIMLGLFGTNCN